MDYRGLAFSDRNLAFTGAPSDAKSKNHRADENQELFHDAPPVFTLLRFQRVHFIRAFS
jgi:hypothetical protein